jgi:hypothetical protein
MIFKAKNFYLSNKTFNSKLPSPPSMEMSDYELANWLLNRSDFAWLELDVNIDLDSWKKEILECKDKIVNHRESESQGWKSACIHGINVEATGAWTNHGYTNEDDVPYNWTEIADKCKTIKTFWENFPYDSYRRIRIMAVEPGGYINPHSDRPGKLPGEENFDALKFGVPINLAVIHPEDCYLTLENHGCVPFNEGKAFIVNIRNYHSVVNFSNTTRYHIIAHGRLDKKINEFVELVARSFRKQYFQQQ